MKFSKTEMEKKQAKLATLNKRSEDALSLVRTTIDGLDLVNTEIMATIAEIEQDQKVLEDTKCGLGVTLHKNQQIMQNFKSLLCAE